MTAWAAQSGASVRLEWGAAAIEHLAGDVDCVVVVDVALCLDEDAGTVAARLVQDFFSTA